MAQDVQTHAVRLTLTREGRDQADAVAERLRALGFADVLVSPRAINLTATAEQIATHFGVEVPDDGATIADVERALVHSHPRLAELADGLAYAIGAEAVPRTHRLGGGETVVVLSPVSGG